MKANCNYCKKSFIKVDSGSVLPVLYSTREMKVMIDFVGQMDSLRVMREAEEKVLVMKLMLPLFFLAPTYEESRRECVIDKIMGDISKPIIICPNCVCVNDSINSKCHCCGESLINLEDREVLF